MYYKDTALILPCKNKMNEVTLKIIDKFGELCKPGHIDNFGKTSLMWVCKNKMNDVALKLIDTFGKNALFFAKINNLTIVYKK